MTPQNKPVNEKKSGGARLDLTSIRQAAERGDFSSRRRLTYVSRVWALQLDNEKRKRAFRSLGLSERAAEVRPSPLQIDRLEPTGSASCSWTKKSGKIRLDPTSIRQAAERDAQEK
ncbi:hypothetical protein Q7A53_21240 [Halobacillus rhizosphaerae]|uniref:hypothetical protein n=1 Tax=Halobacillus rhizosphaerae TaxID=3064889 RepID=UPI00398ADB28